LLPGGKRYLPFAETPQPSWRKIGCRANRQKRKEWKGYGDRAGDACRKGLQNLNGYRQRKKPRFGRQRRIPCPRMQSVRIQSETSQAQKDSSPNVGIGDRLRGTEARFEVLRIVPGPLQTATLTTA